MTHSIQVIDPDNAPLRVERVFVDAHGELRASVCGVECSVGTKEALVSAGVVMFQPRDAKLAQLRPIFSQLNVSRLGNQFWCVATDARLVNAALRFNALKKKGGAVLAQQLWPAE